MGTPNRAGSGRNASAMIFRWSTVLADPAVGIPAEMLIDNAAVSTAKQRGEARVALAVELVASE